MTMKKCLIVIALAVLVSFMGCWPAGTVTLDTCTSACFGLVVAEGCEDECKRCAGACLDLPPLGFNDPILLWMGDTTDEASVPDCPAAAPDLVFDGYGGFDEAHACPTCRCTAPSCELPRGLRGSASAACDGRDVTSFDAPEGWNGACAAPAAEARSDLGSLLIPAPTVTGCAPEFDPAGVDAAGEAAYPPVPWTRRARGCAGSEAKHTCWDPSKMCVASPMPRPPGFAMCALYLRSGEPKCPEEYPELREFYQEYKDTRGCTPCGCSPPEGSACAALVAAYEDARCGQLLGAETVTLAGPKCVAGPDLRIESMDARWIRDEPGTCTPTGGVPTGEATPRSRTFFCCQSDESIPIP